MLAQKLIFTPISNWLSGIGRYTMMVATVIRLSLSKRPKWSLLVPHLYEIGVRSLPLICLTGFATGMVLSAQSFFQLSDKGLTGITGIMVAKSMLVEIGPILTSFMITGRVGASICAELGSMKVTEQIDAMASMGVHPLEYLVVPRYLSMAIMMPILTIFSSACGIFGGWLLATQLYEMNSQGFLEPISVYVTNYDITANFVKSWIFSLVVVSIACYKGFHTKGGAAGVGRSTTSSVVISYCAILGLNFLLTIILNDIYWIIYGFN